MICAQEDEEIALKIQYHIFNAYILGSLNVFKASILNTNSTVTMIYEYAILLIYTQRCWALF